MLQIRLCRHLVVSLKKLSRVGSAFRKFSSNEQRGETPAMLLEDEIDEANERYQGHLEIRETENHGYGLFALKDFVPKELVMVGRAIREEPTQTPHSVQTGWHTHVRMDLPARFINHVCGTANVGIVDNNLGAFDFYALCNIAEGDEVRFDYECTEYEIQAFRCTCGSPLCRRILRGFRKNGSRVRAVYGDTYIASYLKGGGR